MQFDSPVYSLSELCAAIGGTLESELGDTYRIKAEIGSLSVRGGHCYMELVEKASDGAILAAKVRATCWSNIWVMLSAYFTETTHQPLSPGMQVLVDVGVSFHAVYGLSLQIVGIDPTFTLGDLARQREQTVLRLKQDGVFDMQQSLSMPTLPKRIAVISSGSAAGYEDFVHQLQQSGYDFSTVLFSAVMQGDKAAQSLVSALEEVSTSPSAFDVVVIIRGGGASTDLSCFDNYDLASHIAQFPLPVITGIGHQRDVSVADMVAFRSVKTPTAVAEFIIALMDEAQQTLDRLQQRLMLTADKISAVQRERIHTLIVRLQSAFGGIIMREQNRLGMAQKTLALLSPADIFRKGYSLTHVNGRVLRSADEVRAGDVIETCLADGVVRSTVNE